MTVKIKPGEISLGQALPWPIYDGNNRLLLNEGEVIETRNQLDILLKCGLYRIQTPEQTTAPQPSSIIDDDCSPFDLFHDLAFRLDQIFTSLLSKNPESANQLSRLSADIQKLCSMDADAALGALHLYHDERYTIWHPIYVAALCELITRRLDFTAQERLSVLNAALTSNIAMLDLQESLCKQQGKLNAEQTNAVHGHCEEGTLLLQEAGINDELWLDIIMQHHEKINGSGYPRGLLGNTIRKEARIVGLADRYAAMIAPRTYRMGMPSCNALRELFLRKGEEYDAELSVLFIKELGVYPPGAFVKLANGEIAIVIKRGKESTSPTVCSLSSPRGGAYARPLRRNCDHRDYAIKETCVPNKTAPVNLHILWGYTQS